jgi:hypothetical protein
VAYLQAVMTDAHVLAESLLLSNHASCKDSRSDIDITHLRTYMFYSGSALHLFLSAQEPQGWKWGAAEEEAYDQCHAAITEGLKDRILGYNDGPSTIAGGLMTGKRPLPQHEGDWRPKQPSQTSQPKTTHSQGDRKPKSRAQEAGNWRNGRSAQGAGRFDLLGGMTNS